MHVWTKRGVAAVFSSCLVAAVSFVAYSHAESTVHRNTAVGIDALSSTTTGSRNIAVGIDALQHNSTGDDNIAIGHFAGSNAVNPSGSIFIGNEGRTEDSGVIRLGESTMQGRTFIAGIRGTMTDENDSVAVVIDSNGQLGTIRSS